MSLELLNTVATCGTFVVIAATAIAAMIQLRHARSSNQIAALNELSERQQNPEYVRALHFVYSDLPSAMGDPAFRYQLAHRWARTAQYNDKISKTEAIGDWYERLGLLARSGLVDRQLLVETYSALVTDAWNALAEVTAIMREHYGRSLWENFEYITVLSQDWEAKHRDGVYPRGLRRIETPNSWHALDEQYAASLIAEAETVASEAAERPKTR
jgi:hypothetical protein